LTRAVCVCGLCPGADAKPFLRIDLGKKVPIGTIRIYNRNDGYR
jgi:hypothetical protein